MTDIPGNSTNTGRGVFDTNRSLGGFSPTNRRSFFDGALQAAPAAPTLMQIRSTLTSGDVDTYRMQWQGPARSLNFQIQNGSVNLWQHSAANAEPCYPIVRGGRCRTLYLVVCQCYRIDSQIFEESETAINGPIVDIGYFGAGDEQAIYVTNTLGERAVAFGYNASIAANPKILSVQRVDGRPDNCGDVPSYCPVYPSRPRFAGNSFPVQQNDFIYAQISGNSGQAIFRLS